MPDDNTAETEANLRALGAEADASHEAPEVEKSETQEGSQSPAAKEETQTPKQDSQSPDKGNKTEARSPDTGADDKPKSKYQKERERQNKQWDEIKVEKERIRKEREELEQVRTQRGDASFRDSRGHTAKDYENAARQAEQDAQKARNELFDEEGAKEAEAAAQQLRELASNVQKEEWETLCKRAKDEAVTAMPELKNPESELCKKSLAILKEHPLFGRHPDGLKLAPLMAKSQLEAAAAPGLKAKVEELTKENERLVKLTSLSGSRPSRSAASDEDGELTEKNLRRLAAEADNAT